MPFRYDLFISYRRKRLLIGWMSEHFLPLFLDKLEEAVWLQSGRKLGMVFLDIADTDPIIQKQNINGLGGRLAGIPAGADWKQYLKEAIPQARCLLALWSPTYFGSPWCLSEWENFRNRSSENFAVPITVHDCFDLAQVPMLRPVDTDVQYLRFNDTYRSGSAFKDSRAYLDLQDLCDLLAPSVAARIHASEGHEPDPLSILELPDDDGNGPRIGQFRMAQPATRP